MSHNIDNAPAEIKLAVDLIYLLESHHIDNDVVLKALDIVKMDYQRKKNQQQTGGKPSIDSSPIG